MTESKRKSINLRFNKVSKTLNNLWSAYGELDSCNRDEIVEIKVLKDIIEKRLKVLSDELENNGVKYVKKTKI